MTLAELMKQGDELLASHIIPGSPDWEALHGETPDDIEPDEDDGELDGLSYYDPEQEAPDLLMQSLRAALTADLQPLGEALAGALQAGDLPAMQAALRKISANMPELAGDAANLADALAGEFAEAFTEES